jgi:hypothetical protein
MWGLELVLKGNQSFYTLDAQLAVLGGLGVGEGRGGER